MLEVSVGGSVRTLSRSKFRTWVRLEEIREKITKASDVDDLSDGIGQYLADALDVSINTIETMDWEDAANIFAIQNNLNQNVRILPFMLFHPKEDKPVPYDYDGRLFYHYAHAIAKEYGWSLDQIADLDVDDALSLMQEIMVSIHLQREWEWEISERSSGYDPDTRKPKHIPYTLPDWMLPLPAEPKVYRIPKAMLPVGNVVSFRDAKPT